MEQPPLFPSFMTGNILIKEILVHSGQDKEDLS